MQKLCPVCGKEKDNIGPKIVGKAINDTPRLTSKEDVIETKEMCQECCESLKSDLNEVVHKCLSPSCDAILFISGKMSSDSEARGVSRY
jgi:hypothetical protein